MINKLKDLFKISKLSCIMSIVTLIIGIFMFIDTIDYSDIDKIFAFGLSFLPCLIFISLTLFINDAKNNKKIKNILIIITQILLCLMFVYYFIAIFILGLMMATNPITSVDKYKQQVETYRLEKVFPRDIPKDAKSVKFFSRPAFLQGGTEVILYYVDEDFDMSTFNKKHQKMAKWVGHIDEYHDDDASFNQVFYNTPVKNEKDFTIYLIKSSCDNSGWCNHGDYLLAAANDKTNEVVYSYEDW